MTRTGARRLLLAVFCQALGCAAESADGPAEAPFASPVAARGPAGPAADGMMGQAGAAGAINDGAAPGVGGVDLAAAGASRSISSTALDAGTRGGASPPVGGVAAGASAIDSADAGVGAGGVDGGSAADAGVEAAEPTGFQPCPAVAPCKILPLGDSITDGIGFSGGYRVELFRKALADGHDVTFVGGSNSGPSTVDGEPFPRDHEGHSGWTIGQIDGIVPAPALAPAPHIVLLHLGTNDMYRTPVGAPERLGELIDQLVVELPDALVVVSTIIPFPGASGAVDTFNGALAALVGSRAGDGRHVVLIDQFTGFPTSELGDGVHPNQAGYERMAGVWYEAIRDHLP